MEKKNTINLFAELNMDASPLVTANTSMTNALNAALVTLNGDEKVLLNAMGNGRVESAYLPEGYIPMGTCELGGIVYIVSYNPLINKCLIGSFPSPERNVTSDELSDAAKGIKNGDFVTSKDYKNACNSSDGKTWELTTVSAVEYKLKLTENEDGSDYTLTPGDKFKIYVNIPNESSARALTANASTISDIYSDEADIINETPRYLTLRAIAIGDDLKISYLDNGLVWNYKINKDEIGGDYGYYISELEESSSGKVDLDSYRSLTTSGYSIYTGKINGVLALLCEIKAVDTFSVGWDADVDNVDNPTELGLSTEIDKCATIKFYIQYTSSSPRINLKYVLVTGSSLSQVIKSYDSLSDIRCGADFGTGWTLPTFDPKEGSTNTDVIERKNDNTDEEITLATDPFYYSSNSDLYNIVWNYLLTPAMPFGNIDWLAVNGSINFSEIGSGKIELILWKYWALNETTTISWGLEAYPEKNKEIKEVCFSFIPFTWLVENLKNGIDILQIPEKYKEYGYPFYQYWIKEKKSYSGYFQDAILYEDSPYIYKNGLFLVDIFVRYGGVNSNQGDDTFDDRHIYRWLYTTGQWNNQYLDSTITDFNELTLKDVIEIGATFDVTDNITTKEYKSALTLPSTIDDTWDLEWGTMGAMATTVNYDETNKDFSGSANSFIIDADINVSKYNELFGVDIVSLDVEVDYNLDTAYISHDAIKVKTTNTSSYADDAGSLFMDTTSSVNNSKKIEGVNSATSGTIQNLNDTDYWKANNEDIKDSFNAEIKYDPESKTHLTVSLKGVIFSKIRGDVENQECTAQTMLRSVLYEENDLATVGLVHSYTPSGVDNPSPEYRIVDCNSAGIDSYVEFDQYGLLHVKDKGDGHRTQFFTGAYSGVSYERLWDEEYKGHDEQDYDSLDEIPSTIRQKYIQALDNSGGIFNMTKATVRKNGTVYYGSKFVLFDKGATMTGLEHDYENRAGAATSRVGYGGGNYIMLVKSGGVWNTINCFSAIRRGLAGIAAGIYSSLYILINSSTKIEKAIIVNIDYVTDYLETWNTGINTSIRGLNDEYINLNSNDIICSLSELQNIITRLDLDIVQNNITLGLNGESSLEVLIPTYVLSHTFTLRNTDLYNTYLKETSTSIPCLAYTGKKGGGYITLEDTPSNKSVYVYDMDESKFELVLDAPEHIYYTRILQLNENKIIEWQRVNDVENLGITTGINAKKLFTNLVNNDGTLEISKEISRTGSTLVLFNTANDDTNPKNNRIKINGSILSPNLGVNYLKSETSTSLTNQIIPT